MKICSEIHVLHVYLYSGMANETIKLGNAYNFDGDVDSVSHRTTKSGY